MAPQPLNEDVLNSVDEPRRHFLRTLIGTTFAMPLMASFSMDGLLINAAEAQPSPDISCSNMTTYLGPDDFKAHLTGTDTTAQGQAQFKLTIDGTSCAYKLHVSSNVTFQSAGIFVPPFPGAVVTLGQGKGMFDQDDVAILFCDGTPSESFITLLQSMADGQAEVRVQTNEGVIKGQIQSGS
jgi:hypothetical protein